MFIVIYTFLWSIASLGLFVFGFLTGRCARKLPLLDENLPWTLHGGEMLPDGKRRSATWENIPEGPSWPGNLQPDDNLNRPY
jgi:hypothetical protein